MKLFSRKKSNQDIKTILNQLLEKRYEAIRSGQLSEIQIIGILKDIKMILDIKKEID